MVKNPLLSRSLIAQQAAVGVNFNHLRQLIIIITKQAAIKMLPNSCLSFKPQLNLDIAIFSSVENLENQFHTQIHITYINNAS